MLLRSELNAGDTGERVAGAGVLNNFNPSMDSSMCATLRLWFRRFLEDFFRMDWGSSIDTINRSEYFFINMSKTSFFFKGEHPKIVMAWSTAPQEEEDEEEEEW